MTRTAPTPEVSTLDVLTGDAQIFRTEVWASRVHLHRTTPEPLQELFTLEDADRWLTGSALRTPLLRIAQDGSVLASGRFTRSGSIAGQSLSGLVDPRKALALFDDGATIVFQGLHRFHAPLADLCAALELELGHPCQANAYLTPPSAQGFAVHADTHDVFVFQTHGSKLWEVHETLGAPREVLLEPGLVMYLPTGTKHAARSQDGISLHVTVGINQLTWRSLVERTVRRTLADLAEPAALAEPAEPAEPTEAAKLADHLPAGYLDDPHSRAALVEGLAARLAEVADAVRGVDTDAVVQREIDAFFTGRGPRLRGSLQDRDALAGLNRVTLMRRRTGRPFVVAAADPLTPDESATRLRVFLGDRVLNVPGHLQAALIELAEQPVGATFTASLLRRHLDMDSSLVLCRRLVREGALEIVTTAGSSAPMRA